MVVPVRSPENPVNWYPVFAVAWIETFAPELNQPPAVIEPLPAGVTPVVKRYCVANDAVYVVSLSGTTIV